MAPNGEWYWWKESTGWRHAAIPSNLLTRAGWWASALAGAAVGAATVGGAYYSFLADVLGGLLADGGSLRLPAWVLVLPMVAGGWLATEGYKLTIAAVFLGFDKRGLMTESFRWAGMALMGIFVLGVLSVTNAGGLMAWMVTVAGLVIATVVAAFVLRLLSPRVNAWLDAIDAPSAPPPPTR